MKKKRPKKKTWRPRVVITRDTGTHAMRDKRVRREAQQLARRILEDLL